MQSHAPLYMVPKSEPQNFVCS